MIDSSIEPILGNQVYAPKKVGDWTSAIVEAVLKLLQAANKPFKYVGQLTIWKGDSGRIPGGPRVCCCCCCCGVCRMQPSHCSSLSRTVAVTCIIMQKNGAGLHTASTCFWDTKSDGQC